MVSNKDMNICNFFFVEKKEKCDCILMHTQERQHREDIQRGDMQSTNSHGTVEGRKIE